MSVPLSWVPTSILSVANSSGVVTDAALDSLISSVASGAVIDIPPDVTVSLSQGHIVNKPLTFRSLYKGGFLDTRTSPTGPLFTITSGGVHFSGVKFTGSVVGQYFASHYALQFQGVDNGAGLAPTYLDTVSAVGAEFSGFGSLGIFAEFISNYRFDDLVMHDLGYGGLIFNSASHGTINNPHIRAITPGTSGNAYAIALSRRDQQSDLIRYPVSQDCSITGGHIWGAAVWDGINTHGGLRISVTGTTFYNCKKPIEWTSSTDSSGNNYSAPKWCSVTGIIADSGVSDASLGMGIVIAGAAGAADGTSQDLAVGCTVTGCIIRGHGTDTSSSGAVWARNTQGLIVTGNTFIEPCTAGVNLVHDNYDFYIGPNVVIDAWSNATTVSAGVAASVDYNKGVVDGVLLSRGTKSATSINAYGVRVANDANSLVKIGPGNDLRQAVTADASFASKVFGLLSSVNGHLKVFGGGATPTLTAAAAAGTSPPTPIFDSGVTGSGNDVRGVIEMGTGTGPAAGNQVTLTFATTYTTLPTIAIAPLNLATAALQPYATASATGITFGFAIAPGASQALNTYRLSFQILT